MARVAKAVRTIPKRAVKIEATEKKHRNKESKYHLAFQEYEQMEHQNNSDQQTVLTSLRYLFSIFFERFAYDRHYSIYIVLTFNNYFTITISPMSNFFHVSHWKS